MNPLAAIAAAALGAAQPVPAAQTAEVMPHYSGPVLKMGTRVAMRTTQPLSSKTAHQGQRFDLLVTEPVLVDGMVVVPLGARGIGEVRRVVEKGVFGKAGKLEVQVLFVEVAGTRIRLDGHAGDKGASGAAGVAVGLPLVGLSSAFISGTSAKIPAGAPVDGYVYQDLPLRSAAGN